MTRRYPSYRASGVASIGDIPSHWRTVVLGRIGSFFKGGGGTKEDETEEGHACVRYGDLYTRHDFHIRESRSRINPDRAAAYTELQYGDLLLAGSGETLEEIGKSAANLIREPAFCGGDVVICRPEVEIDATFLGYAADCFPSQHQKSGMGRGVTVMHIYSSELKKLAIPFPPVDEQVQIGAYLGSETARIDKLISMQESLVERLDEYMTALITWVVTRGLPPEVAEAAGLDPTPKLKDSGVGWLGEVPEHWAVVENRRLFAERDDRSADGKGELLTVSHITGVGRRSNRPDVGMFMAETLEGYKRCDPGDLVVNTMWAWMGAAGTSAEAGLVSPSYNVYSPDVSRLNPRFADIAYRSRRYVVGMTSESRGIWTSRLRLYPQQFLSLVTAVPPMAEQEAIVAHVDTAEDRAKRMARAIRASIERLREYRSVMISAAVTGKIDVRDAALVGAGGGA